ncbi:hypothetical protein [Methanolacinia paynteri]|uniref:hypothetical protein n=1 Tax=Methanolacinia paynteri TaxID=230356 RepID=UPI00064FFBE3|nr:hypothetical protein [Methanolacinia paynteri]
MEDTEKTRKNIVLFIAAVCIISFALLFAYTAYHHIFTPDTVYFAGAFPFEETDLSPGSVILDLNDSDFEQYPVLSQLVNDPEGGHITFNHFEWNYDEIQDFRDQYCVKRELNRYVRWNGTCYQIVVGQS